jgi:sirohydrochlorin ferrochelatase
MQQKKAVLLIAHGSRKQDANEDLVLLAEELISRGEYPIIEYCYLELAEPDIMQGFSQCLEKGATEILMMPYFLSAGAHAVKDMKDYRTQFLKKHPEINVQLCKPLSRHPQLVDIVLARIQEGTDS